MQESKMPTLGTLGGVWVLDYDILEVVYSNKSGGDY